MLISIATTMPQARQFGFLLHKHPDRNQDFPLRHGTLRVLFPEATDERCEVALLLDVDTKFVFEQWRGRGEALSAHVNDRPYASGSLLAASISQVLRSALHGECRNHEELLVPLPLEVTLPVVRSYKGAEFLQDLFSSVGWDAQATGVALPGMGDSSPLASVVLRGTMTLQHALSTLVVILAAVDAGALHYVEEADALHLARIAPWLVDHPHREMLLRRNLAGQKDLVQTAATALGFEVESRSRGFNEARLEAVHAAVRDLGATSVADFGCGEGNLLVRLGSDPALRRIIGCDLGESTLRRARLALDDLPEHQRRKVRLWQSSALLPDARIHAEVAVLVEVIEHLDPWRLRELEKSVLVRFPATVLTTPNAEYNVLLGEGMRHSDHRFEWTRSECTTWAEGVAQRNGLTFEHRSVGSVHPEYGSATQMIIFRRNP